MQEINQQQFSLVSGGQAQTCTCTQEAEDNNYLKWSFGGVTGSTAGLVVASPLFLIALITATKPSGQALSYAAATLGAGIVIASSTAGDNVWQYVNPSA